MKTTTTTLFKKDLRSIQSEVSHAHVDFEKSLLKRAFFKTSNLETSEDLVQTTFLKTILYLQKGEKIDLMRSFLNHIMNDLIIDEYRRNKNTSLDTLLEKGFEPGLDESNSDNNIFDGKVLTALVPLLPKKYKTVIRLRYLKGLSLREISLITNQSENTVAVQVHRGLIKLKALQKGE